jgi:hypothetical protein
MIGFELLIYDGKKELVTVAKNEEKIRISFVYVELVIIYLNAYYYSSGLPKILNVLKMCFLMPSSLS